MKFCTKCEALDWWALVGGAYFDRDSVLKKGNSHKFEINYKQLTFIASAISDFTPFSKCVLLVNGWGIFESSENLHLYYRLRQSYSNLDLLEDTPAHIFLSYERADLLSFIQVAALNCWDFFLLFEPNYISFFFSHDEYLSFYPQKQDLSRDGGISTMFQMLKQACSKSC